MIRKIAIGLVAAAIATAGSTLSASIRFGPGPRVFGFHGRGFGHRRFGEFGHRRFGFGREFGHRRFGEFGHGRRF